MPLDFTDKNPLVALHDVARLCRTRADQLARTRGMTRAQWIILLWLDHRPGMSQNELAAHVDVEPITVGRLIDRLEARGLVERRADKSDRRIRRLHVTRAAAPILEEIEVHLKGLRAVVMADISPDMMETMTNCLQRMKANLSAELREEKSA
jgi:DNA-binding MarR family transcriptional regulator